MPLAEPNQNLKRDLQGIASDLNWSALEVMRIVERHADVEIRATDLDSSSKGWAAIIRGLVDRRVKLVLDDGLALRAWLEK